MTVTRFSDHLLAGVVASRPAANAVPVGALYSATDEGLIYQSDGSTWSTYATLGGTSPLTTKGDLLTFDTADDRLPVGTDGQVLTADSGEALGIKWADAAGGSNAYAMDDLTNYDVRHGSPLGSYDNEFNAAETTSLPSGWSWVNQGDSTYRESGGLARILAATSGDSTSSTETHRMIVRALPTESEWIAELKLTGLNGEQAATVRGGMVLRNSGSGNYLFFGRAVSDANIGRFKVDRWSALNTVDTVEHERLMVTPPTVLRLTFYDTGNSSFYAGTDGLITYWVGDVDLSAEGYDQIGILCGTPDTALDFASVSFDWFRVRS